MSVAIGGAISTVATGALIEAFGGTGVKGADDNVGILSSAGSNGGDGGSSSSPVEVSVTGTIQSSAGDGIDVLAQGGTGDQGGLGQSAPSASGGAGGAGGSAPQSTLTISGSVSAATFLYEGVIPSNGALVRNAGGQGGDGNGGNYGVGGNGGTGGNGNNATLTLQSGGSLTGGINVLSAVSVGGDGGAGGDASGLTTIGGNGGVGGVGGNATVDVGQPPTGVSGATTSVTGAPHQATVAVSAISYGGAGGRVRSRRAAIMRAVARAIPGGRRDRHRSPSRATALSSLKATTRLPLHLPSLQRCWFARMAGWAGRRRQYRDSGY